MHTAWPPKFFEFLPLYKASPTNIFRIKASGFAEMINSSFLNICR